MRFPGFGRQRPVVAETADGREVVLERRPGESVEAFEARRAAYEHEPRFAGAGAVDPRTRRDAYVDGRRDQRRVDKAELHDRRAPPRRRRGGGMGFIGVVVVLVAALGVLWLVLAAREGSFAAGGALVDQKVAEVTSPARVAATEAVDRTGVAVQNAGQALESQGEAIRQKAQ